jgi:FAD/FMN-containing dehydrogenase
VNYFFEAQHQTLRDEVLRFDENARRAAGDDFGHIVGHTPAAVLVPATSEDLAVTIRWAARHGCTFAPRGQGHSTYGRSQAAGGIVAAMSALHDIGAIEGDRVVVAAGATWREVLVATLPHGRTPPVLADYLDLSVGGTLAVGGIGPRTSTFGAQTDNVLELEVVTGAGDTLVCAPDRNADLFDAVRAGLGQVAVITKATLRLVAAPEAVRWLRLFYTDLPALLRDMRKVTDDGRFDAVQGSIAAAPEGELLFRLDAAKHFNREPPDDRELVAGLADDVDRREPATQPYLEHLDRLAPLEAALRANGQWWLPHPWLATFVGDSRVEAVVSTELQMMEPASDLGAFGQVLLSPIRRSAISTPMLRLPDERLCFAFTFIRFPATRDPDRIARLVQTNRAVYTRIRDAGGTVYPVGAVPMSAAEWRRHFGPVFGQLAAAKDAFDPACVLTPGYELFPR